MADGRNSNVELLEELDALSQTLYQSHTSRRTASLVLPRSATPVPVPVPEQPRPRSRRMSMSPFRSRPKSNPDPVEPQSKKPQLPPETSSEKKGIWGWKPMRALSHIGMQRLECLFSVEAVAAQGLPVTMNGLRLAVFVRKKETKDGAVKTMPARVLQGSADFEETLFIRCHLYCTGRPPKFEPRLFVVSAVPVDAPELNFGASTVDLSSLVRESMEKSVEGARVRQWDMSFPLSGKARGGELLLKLGFQIIDDGGGVGIYAQADGARSSKKGLGSPSAFGRKQSKSSFSVTSPRITRSETPVTPSQGISAIDLKGIDDFSLDEPDSPPPSRKPPEPKDDEFDQDLPEFEIVDRGIEIQSGGETEDHGDEKSVSSEVVKEVVVVDNAHLVRMTELDAIAKQIKALESLMTGDEASGLTKTTPKDETQRLDADEETVTREFLQMLELEDDDKNDLKLNISNLAKPTLSSADGESRSFISDLGKGLGPVVQTRDGGYLAAMNPFNVELHRKDTPKLAMQISKPLILPYQNPTSGFEVLQKLSAMGSEALVSKLASLTSMDDLTGKTAEQIAFEGIASAIISGRNKEGDASSSAARSVAVLRSMASAMAEGRKERIATGIWNVREDPVIGDEILAVAMQKMEAMAVEALKIQAGIADEEAPFDASPIAAREAGSGLEEAGGIEDWARSSGSALAMVVVVQMRDPVRRYEAVGAPAIGVVTAARVDGGDDEARFKVTGLSVGGVRRRGCGRWDGERERLTAMQWLVGYGLGKRRGAKKGGGGGAADLVWSLSSRVMADMWLKGMRNPDIKIPDQV